jgi:hypothetical protein
VAAPATVTARAHVLPALRDTCRHVIRWQPGRPGDVERLAAALGVACEHPGRMVCAECGGGYVRPCRTSRSSFCGPCGELYRSRVQQVAKAPAVLAVPGSVFLLTVTAPGSVRHGPRAGIDCGCWVSNGSRPVDLASWNGRQGERWNRFAQDLRRLLGDQVEYFRAVEVQRRGALHEHVLGRFSAPVLVTSRLRSRVRALAIAHGYGHEIDLQVAGQSAASARLVAWYCAKYVSKATDARADVPWQRRDVGVDLATGEVLRSPWSYRTWTASRAWGSSMGAVVRDQRAFATGAAGSEYAGLNGTFLPAPRSSQDLARQTSGQGPP